MPIEGPCGKLKNNDSDLVSTDFNYTSSDKTQEEKFKKSPIIFLSMDISIDPGFLKNWNKTKKKLQLGTKLTS